MLKIIAPEAAARLIRDGAVLVDVREPDEHLRLRIPGARNIPLSRIELAEFEMRSGRPVLFHCRSGMRTTDHADRLAGLAAGCEVYGVEGGLDAWKRAGLPVTEDRSQPLELMRQVQIAAGTLVLLGVALGWLVSPWLFGIAAFVGGGLVFAGITGFCGMARLLRVMPWNRVAALPDAG